MTLGHGIARGLSGLTDPRQLRSRWLGRLAQLTDGYMRSPIFLICMRYGLAAALGAQSLQTRGLARPARDRRARAR